MLKELDMLQYDEYRVLSVGLLSLMISSSLSATISAIVNTDENTVSQLKSVIAIGKSVFGITVI